MSKIDAKKLTEAISKSLTDSFEKIASTVAENDSGKDKDKDGSQTVINFDEEKFAKSLADNLDTNSPNDEEIDDEENEYEDEYDEMSKKELVNSCGEKEIKVFSKTTEEMMKTKLREFDKVKLSEDESDDSEDDGSDDKTVEEKQKALQEGTDKLVKDLGLDPKKVKVEVTGVKKSQDTDKGSPHDNEDEDEEYDSLEDEKFTKTFSELSEDDQDEAVGDFIFQTMKTK